MSTGYHQFVSVMTPVASTGDITLELQSFDASENMTISVIATGLPAGTDEIQTAILMQSQIQDQLIQYGVNYDLQPNFDDEGFPAQWRLERTEHILSFAAQCRFRIRETANTTGSVIVIHGDGVLMTVTEARSKAAIFGITFADSSGTAFTDSQVAEILTVTSETLIGYLSNPIVAAGYFRTITGRDFDGVALRPKPGIKVDNLRVRSRRIGLLTGTAETLFGKGIIWDADKNTIRFRWTNNLVRLGNPFSMNTWVMVSYVAGHLEIPLIVKNAALQLAGSAISGESGKIQSLQGDSFRITFFAHKDQINSILLPLRKFIL